MGSFQTLWRSRLRNKYHYCARCGVRYPLGKMIWQNGLLVCLANCYDTMLPQERDSIMDRAVQMASQSNELQPDKMLTDSAVTSDDDVDYMP